MTMLLPPMVLSGYRLLLVLGITLYHVSRVIATSLAQGWNGNRVAGQARAWADDLVKRLHIHIHLEGRLPGRGVLVVSNHRSYLDIVVILAHIESAFLAKAELRKWPVFGYASMKGNTVFVDRSDRQSRERSRQQLSERLAQGISVVVFPEGTTHEGPGLLDFKTGIFHLAAEKEIPVVPVAVCYENPAAAWVGQDSFVPHFLKIFKNRQLRVHMVVGPVMTQANAGELKQSCRAYIETALISREPTGAEQENPESCLIPDSI